MPVTPNIIHTAKQTMNAQVVTSRTMIARAFDMMVLVDAIYGSLPQFRWPLHNPAF
jgi:hypothetical protein